MSIRSLLLVLVAMLFVLAILTFQGCVTMTANTQTGKVTYTRMFEDQDIAGLTIEKGNDGNVSIKLEKMKTSSKESDAIKAVSAIIGLAK